MAKTPDLSTKVTLAGPFFTHNPGKTVRGNVRDLMGQLAEWSEGEVRGIIQANASQMPGYDGWSYAHTRGRVESVEGKRWGTWARVSAFTGNLDAADAKKTKAAAATIERRWHPYRRVKSALYSARPLLTADLTKGLN